MEITKEDSILLHGLLNIYTTSMLPDASVFYEKFGQYKRWICFSDYCLEDENKNDVITFTFFPQFRQVREMAEKIKTIAPRYQTR